MKSNKRIAFIFTTSDYNWNGGVNYFFNLFNSFKKATNEFEIILLTDKVHDSYLNNIVDEKIVSRIFKKYNIFWIIRLVVKKILKKDFLLERLCISNNIMILSHSGIIGKKSKIKCLPNIFDLQHIFLPNYFDKSEIKKRNRNILNYIKFSNSIIVSSNTSKFDLIDKFDVIENKIDVLKFISNINEKNTKNYSDLEKYNLPSRYFHIPNQFWQHKNHMVVLESLKYNDEVSIVCTGSIEDNRNNDFYSSFLTILNNYKLYNRFIILGNIDYNEMKLIMEKSLAVINPSFYEGWSTSVEEALSLKKYLFLSDIPIHREQISENVIFFDPNDPINLSKILSRFSQSPITVINNNDNLNESKKIAYGNQYLKILNKTIND